MDEKVRAVWCNDINSFEYIKQESPSSTVTHMSQKIKKTEQYKIAPEIDNKCCHFSQSEHGRRWGRYIRELRIDAPNAMHHLKPAKQLY